MLTMLTTVITARAWSPATTRELHLQPRWSKLAPPPALPTWPIRRHIRSIIDKSEDVIRSIVDQSDDQSKDSIISAIDQLEDSIRSIIDQWEDSSRSDQSKDNIRSIIDQSEDSITHKSPEALGRDPDAGRHPVHLDYKYEVKVKLQLFKVAKCKFMSSSGSFGSL